MVLTLIAIAVSSHFRSQTTPAEAATVTISIMDQGCLSDGNARVVISWSAPLDGTVFIDVSTRDNRFIPGSFIGLGGFNPVLSGFAFDGFIPGQRHFIRANMLTPFGFMPSSPISFFTPNCFPTFASPTFASPTFGSPTFATAPVVVTISQECQADHRVRVRLMWNSLGLGPQFADISSAGGFFFPGTFTGFSVPSFQNTFTFDLLPPGRQFFVRVNTLTPFGFQPSGTVAFVTRTDC